MANLVEMGVQARKAAKHLAITLGDVRNQAIYHIADQVEADKKEILAANQADISAAQDTRLQDAMLDRLMLNEKRLINIVNDLRQVASLPDPVGEMFEQGTLPNGLRIRKQRVPLGVLGVIYEARPNVTLDVSGLAIKSGNCAILRGGSETIQTNRALAGSIQRGLAAAGLNKDIIQMITDTDRALVMDLLQLDQYVDMIIPRGGAVLHEFCRKNSRIPVITGGIGICHLFVDESANLDAALDVIENAKIQRPTVCNALDTILVHKAVAAIFVPAVVRRLAQDGVTFRVDPNAVAWCDKEMENVVQPAGPDDFDTEWLSLVLGIKVVEGLREAVEHISQHSTGHSDGILTENEQNAADFVMLVDSAAVYVNASTRFTDGSQLGLGAEVAISTQRLHARGPMGLRELTTYKWVVEGNYHIRP
jgi:glutamate-5-semialdehyde dehydrogenase